MKRTYIIVLTIISLFITITGASFAFFLLANDNESFDTTVTAAMISNIDFVHGPDLVIPPGGIYPGWAGIQEFTIATPDGLTEGTGAFEIVLEATVPAEYTYAVTIEVYKTTNLSDTITVTPLTLEDYTTQPTLQPLNDKVTSNQINIPEDIIKAEPISIIKGKYVLDRQNFDLATWQDTKYFVVYRNNNVNMNENDTMNKTISSTIKVNSIDEFEETKYTDPILSGSDPVYSENLIPVNISNDGTITRADISQEWYNYSESKWANAVTLGIMEEIEVGTIIPQEKIYQMYTWIPRYEYTKSSIESSSDAIDINFVSKTIKNNNIETQDTIVHPAFTYGDIEISGIWVGKFEFGDSGSIKPNQNSTGSYDIGRYYNEIYNASYYSGFHSSSSVHMIKNTEWGATAYLSQSKYGICNENGTCTVDNTTTGTPLKVENNNYYIPSSNNTITGCGGNDTPQEGECPLANRWETQNGVKASTTHNITGVYDMAGGKNEYVMSVMKSSDNITIDWPTKSPYPSGFTADNIPNDPKYYDVYPYGTTGNNATAYSRSLIGDGILELNPSSGYTWNQDTSMMPFDDSSYILRGGSTIDGTGAGLWKLSATSGSAYPNRTIRLAISITANY